MTNEEAAAMLESMKDYFLPTSPLLEERREITAIDLAISALRKQSASSEQADKAWDMLLDVHDMPDVPDKAKDIIGDVMLMTHQMIARADESIIADFVTYQHERLRNHKFIKLSFEDEATAHIFLRETGEEYIEYLDKLGQFEVKPGKNGEDRTKDDEGPKLFGKRTIIKPGEQFIGEDLLKEALDHIAEPDKMVDQFRDSAKKTEDGKDTNVLSNDCISRQAAIDVIKAISNLDEKAKLML